MSILLTALTVYKRLNPFKDGLKIELSLDKGATMSILSLALSVLMSFISVVYAQDMESSPQSNKPYLFSGPCSSQGSWTQDALVQTNRLREITLQLRDDPNCKVLGDSLQRSFTQIYSDLDNMQKGMNGNEVKASNLGKEIRALRETGVNNPILQKVLNSNMLTKLFDYALIKSSSNDLKDTQPTRLSSQEKTELLANFGNRMSRVANRGFTIFNQAIDSLPRLQTCLTDTNTTGQVIAASVSMLGALVSSGEDPLGTQTALAISKLSNVMRDAKFAGVLKKLNQQEYMASIQCIMETTSESFCSARDSRILYDQMKKDLQVRQATKKEEKTTPFPAKIKFDNPLYGFYVLTQFSPIITDWLFRVQIGSSPKLREDGAYQIRILNDVNNFYTATKTIEAEFNNITRNISTFPDYDSKKTYAKDLVIKISNLLLQGGGNGVANMTENFFQKAGSPAEIPFKLLGIPIPQEVISGGSMMPAGTWLDNNYKNMPVFQDPENVPNIVWKNLQVIMQAASSNAINYYNKNFVADPIGMVNDSFVGLPFNIKSALQIVDSYLAKLSEKIKAHGKDTTLVGSIEDTRIRIGKIFYRYNDLKKFVDDNKDLGKSKTDSKTEAEYRKTLLKKNVDLIDEVYKQFEVMIAKSGFLANRLITYVQADFQMFVKDSLNSTSEKDLIYKEIAFASGKMIFDRLQQMAGNNPATLTLDLDSALRIYKENLAAQEMLLADSYINILSQLKLSAERQHFDSRTVTFDSIKRAYSDGWNKTNNEDRNVVTRFATGLWNSAKALTGFEEQKYPVQYKSFVGLKDDTIYTTDDEFNSAKNVFNRMCIQGLAFTGKENMRAVYNLCKSVILKSPFDINQIPDEFKKDYNDYLSINYYNKLMDGYQQNYRLNHSNRICAFRDYNRRNLVVNLTVNFKDVTRLENNYSDNPYQDYTEIQPDPSISPVQMPAVDNSSTPASPNPQGAQGSNPTPSVDENSLLVPDTFQKQALPVQKASQSLATEPKELVLDSF